MQDQRPSRPAGGAAQAAAPEVPIHGILCGPKPSGDGYRVVVLTDSQVTVLQLQLEGTEPDGGPSFSQLAAGPLPDGNPGPWSMSISKDGSMFCLHTAGGEVFVYAMPDAPAPAAAAPKPGQPVSEYKPVLTLRSKDLTDLFGLETLAARDRKGTTRVHWVHDSVASTSPAAPEEAQGTGAAREGGAFTVRPSSPNWLVVCVEKVNGICLLDLRPGAGGTPTCWTLPYILQDCVVTPDSKGLLAGLSDGSVYSCQLSAPAATQKLLFRLDCGPVQRIFSVRVANSVLVLVVDGENKLLVRDSECRLLLDAIDGDSRQAPISRILGDGQLPFVLLALDESRELFAYGA